MGPNGVRTGNLFVALLAFILPTNLFSQDVVRWEESEGGNGHLYQAVLTEGSVTWRQASLAAEEEPGEWYLATITSPEENEFVFNLINDDRAFWSCCSSGNASGPWLGGRVSASDCETFEWVTGEPFEYANWGEGAPGCVGDRLAFFGFRTLMGPTWHDHPDDFGASVPVFGYILESEGSAGGQVPGDCNTDGTLDLTDAICLLGFLFLGSPGALPCGDGSATDSGNVSLMDWQPDEVVDLSDTIALLTFLFLGAAPHPLAVPDSPVRGCATIAGCPINPECP